MRKVFFTVILGLVIGIACLAGKIRTEPVCRVGVANVPPFVISGKGSYSGICIDLWRSICDSLKMSSSYVIYQSFDSLLKDVNTGKLDISICPFTITSDRLKNNKLSIPFFISNMGIATKADKKPPLLRIFENLISWKVLRWLISLFIIALCFSILLWLAERKRNTAEFRPGFRGVFDGVWWAFVTMTTVGYGDKVPKTKIGRILAILWMFFAIGLFFLSTGVISSELTVTSLQTEITDLGQLDKLQVGTISQSGYAETLTRNNIRFINFPTLMDGLGSVSAGLIDAFVYDETIMKYVIPQIPVFKNIVVIPSGLNIQYFCFITRPQKSALLDRINPELLKIIDSDDWQSILDKYLIRK